MIKQVALIGTGNVAFHLSKILLESGIKISCIASRNIAEAKSIAASCKSTASTIEKLCSPIDLVIIAVSDDAIAQVARQIPVGNYMVVHTSGSIPMQVFENRFKNYGVLYPLQSFSKSRELKFNEIPMLIEGNKIQTTALLKSFAGSFSNRVVQLDSEKRGKLHLSAVIANNFVNFLAAKSYDYLAINNIDGTLLQPLFKETVARLEFNRPDEMQTGPAKRNDKKVIEKHVKQLESDPELQSLYRLISKQIIEKYHGG